MRAINNGRSKLLSAGLKKALKNKDHATTLEAASKAVDVLAKVLQPALESVLHDALLASGDIAGKNLRKQLRSATGFRNATDWAFDKTNPKATDWAKTHAAETVAGISEDTRQQIRDVVEEAFAEQFDVDELASEIADIIGDEARAEVIARTETMRASNEGQLEAWDQATEAGLLTGDEQKEWIVTPDDRLCPICEPMDGETTAVDDDFDVDGDQIDAPPAHPNCRCTIGLVLPGEEK